MTMAVSKKSSASKSDLKLSTLENNFNRSLKALTKHVLQQETRLSKTLDSLKVKLKKAVAQQKLVKKSKKTLKPAAFEKQTIKAQTAVDALELEIALTTDQLAQAGSKADYLLDIAEIEVEEKPAPKAKKAKAAKPKKAKTEKIKAEKAEPKTKLKTKKKAKAKKIEAVPEVEAFDLSEIIPHDAMMAPEAQDPTIN
jgi:hypothetical protein